MDAVGAVDIDIAGRAEHHRVARRAAAIGMRRRIGVVIGLDLDDEPPTPSTNSVAPISSGATSCTRRAKKRG